MFKKSTSLWLLVLCFILSLHLTIAAESSPNNKKRWNTSTKTTSVGNCDDDTGLPTGTTKSVMQTYKPLPTKAPDSSSTTKTTCSSCQQVPPKYGPQVIGAAVLLMLFGFYLFVVGFPFFRVTVIIVGLLLGAAITYISLRVEEPKAGYPLPSTFYLSCCVGGGLLLGGFCMYFYRVTIYIIPGMAGYLLSLFICTWKEDFILTNILARNLVGLGIGFIFILSVVLIEFATIIISLSFLGAYVFVLGLDLFVQTGFLVGLKNILYFNRHQIGKDGTTYIEAPESLVKYTIDTKVYGMLCAVFGLWIVACIWQRYYNRGTRFGLNVILNSNDTLKAKFEEGNKK